METAVQQPAQAPQDPGSGAATRRWLVMASVSAGIFLGTIDGSIVNIALPVLERDLGADFASVQWVVLAYLLASTVLLPAAGRLGDMLGKKHLYILGFAVFTAGSGLCALSWGISWLIAFRVIQAVGGALVVGLGAAIVTETFPASERGRALGITGTMVSIGLVSGPTLGGLILASLSWRWIFLVNLPVGAIGIAMAARFIPHLKPRGAQKFDYQGAALLLGGLSALLLALTVGQRAGFLSAAPICLFAGSAAAAALFVLRERSTPYPVLALGMFRNRLLRVNLVTGFMTFFCAQSTVLLMPFFLQNIKEYTPSQAGLLLAVVPLLMGITAPIAGSISDRFGTRPLTAIGLAVLLGGYVGLQSLGAGTTAAEYVLMFLPIGIGAGLFQSPNNSAIMGSVDRDSLGVASGLLSLTRVLGMTTGMAVMGALWAQGVGSISGTGPTAAATSAPAWAQVESLHRTLWISAAIILAGLMLSLGALRSRPEESCPR